MAKKSKTELQNTKGEDYLSKIFVMLKKREELVFESKDSHFNNTEIRLLREIVLEGARGNRLISTQLAKRLGVTRSAVSQIVNNLEARGVVKRVAAEDDKKIAYIEIGDGVMEKYGQDIQSVIVLTETLVEKFGEEKFNLMFELYNDFTDMAKEYIQSVK